MTCQACIDYDNRLGTTISLTMSAYRLSEWHQKLRNMHAIAEEFDLGAVTVRPSQNNTKEDRDIKANAKPKRNIEAKLQYAPRVDPMHNLLLLLAIALSLHLIISNDHVYAPSTALGILAQEENRSCLTTFVDTMLNISLRNVISVHMLTETLAILDANALARMRRWSGSNWGGLTCLMCAMLP